MDGRTGDRVDLRLGHVEHSLSLLNLNLSAHNRRDWRLDDASFNAGLGDLDLLGPVPCDRLYTKKKQQ